ncbi:hypothetical protein VTO73DRAFT_15581 [Trametes versicolor]
MMRRRMVTARTVAGGQGPRQTLGTHSKAVGGRFFAILTEDIIFHFYDTLRPLQDYLQAAQAAQAATSSRRRPRAATTYGRLSDYLPRGPTRRPLSTSTGAIRPFITYRTCRGRLATRHTSSHPQSSPIPGSPPNCTKPDTRHESQVPRCVVFALYDTNNMLELKLGSQRLLTLSLAISQERVDADAFRRHYRYCTTPKALCARFWQPRTSTPPVNAGVLSHSQLWGLESPDRDCTTTPPCPATQAGST